jgi:ParB family chromosome partitioning protein
MPKPKGGLGRGLGALIPPEITPDATVTTQTATDRGTLDVPVGSITPNPHQPRQAMEPHELEELAASIREHGVLQPLVVTRTANGKYSLIAGERRWRASMLAGLKTVPVLVKEASSREMLELALVENLQRADLNPLEEATAYKALVDEFGMKQEQVATRVGKSRQAVTNSLRLLRLPEAAQESLALGLITEGHARAILQVPTEAGQLRLLERTVADDLNVRQVEALARRLAEAANQQEKRTASQQEETPLYDELRELQERIMYALGAKVQLSRSRRGGKLVIYFSSDEELDRIYGAIVGEET